MARKMIATKKPNNTAGVISIAGPSCLLAAAFLALYGLTLTTLVGDWWTDPDYSFGLIVPFVVAYIVYSRRRLVLDSAGRPNTLAGMSLILVSQLMFLAGFLGAEFFLQRSSIVVFGAGCAIYLGGWKKLRVLLLPLLLIELCIPLPSIVLQQLTMPMQLFASKTAETVLSTLGLSVYRSGNILQLQNQTLNVGEACSGIRSLSSLLSLAVILVSSSRLAWPIQIAFVTSAAGVAIVANALRVSGIGLLSEYCGRYATRGAWHWFEGWFVFIIAFLCLSVELAILRRICGSSAARSEA